MSKITDYIDFYGSDASTIISTLKDIAQPLLPWGGRLDKLYYPEKHKAILDKLVAMRKECPKEEVRRLYNILFNIIREDYGTVHEFIK